jgi:hypothetical protein
MDKRDNVELEQYVNQKLLEELEQIAELAKPLRYSDKHDILLDRIEELTGVIDETLTLNVNKLNRLELINHAKNDKAVGRLLTLYKELKDFKSLELSVQDDGKTLKIFLN